MRIKPEQLHKWYLEAVKDLDSGSFNPKANVPYDKLSYQQKFIDEYIASCINIEINKVENKKLDEIKDKLDIMIKQRGNEDDSN